MPLDKECADTKKMNNDNNTGTNEDGNKTSGVVKSTLVIIDKPGAPRSTFCRLFTHATPRCMYQPAVQINPPTTLKKNTALQVPLKILPAQDQRRHQP
jgi:hypothetical protein